MERKAKRLMRPRELRLPVCWFLCLATALVAGCRSESSTPQPAVSSGGDPAAPTPAGEAVIEAPRTGSAAYGSLAGTVSFAGDEIMPQTMIPIQTDPEYCEMHGTDGMYPSEDYLIDPESRGIRNVIVYLMGDALQDWPAAEQASMVIDNRNCRFEPHVNVSVAGSTVEVRNSDEVYHTTHLYGPPGFIEFNPGMRSRGDSETTILTRPGLYQVKCDRHGWMSAYLRVDTHPFQAVTDEKGQFTITGIPPGTYQLGMFHERLRVQARDPQAIDVTIRPGEEASAELTLGG